jgi:hypothetical protein
MRAPDGAPPIVAVSAPAWTLPPDDPRATAVLTVVADEGGATITCAGTGAASDAAGAERVLDRWLDRARLRLAGALAIAMLIACGGPQPQPQPQPEPEPQPQPEPQPEASLDETAGAYADMLAGGDSEPGPATAEVLADRPSDLAPEPDPYVEPPEIVLYVSTGEVTGGESWLEEPIARKRAAFAACSKRLELHGTFRATIVLSERGQITEIVGLDDGDDGRRCLGKALRGARFRIPDGTSMPEVYLRLEID